MLAGPEHAEEEDGAGLGSCAHEGGLTARTMHDSSVEVVVDGMRPCVTEQIVGLKIIFVASAHGIEEQLQRVGCGSNGH